MCIARLTTADDPDQEYQEFTEADLAAKLEAEQEAARLVKVEASTATEGDDSDKCCSNDADDGKNAK